VTGYILLRDILLLDSSRLVEVGDQLVLGKTLSGIFVAAAPLCHPQQVSTLDNG
jgi:hypothetical protein